MNPMDPIPRAAFLKRVNRTKGAFDVHRNRREALLWSEPLKRESTKPLTFLAYDAATFFMAFAFVSQGPSWQAIATALPGFQYTLRDGIDRKGCCATITILSETELLCGGERNSRGMASSASRIRLGLCRLTRLSRCFASAQQTNKSRFRKNWRRLLAKCRYGRAATTRRPGLERPVA
jgi:hypothetical protein